MNVHTLPELVLRQTGMSQRRHRNLVALGRQVHAHVVDSALFAADDGRVKLGQHHDAHWRSATTVWYRSSKPAAHWSQLGSSISFGGSGWRNCPTTAAATCSGVLPTGTARAQPLRARSPNPA